MKTKWTFEDVYDQFLTYTASCTLSVLTDVEIKNELDKMLLRALSEFMFPQVSLDYETDPETNITSFVDKDFGLREIAVIIAYMKKYYHEWMLSKESNFQQQYYDSDTRTHSQANMVKQLLDSYKEATAAAEAANRNYLRMDNKRKARIGAVNA